MSTPIFIGIAVFGIIIYLIFKGPSDKGNSGGFSGDKTSILDTHWQ